MINATCYGFSFDDRECEPIRSRFINFPRPPSSRACGNARAIGHGATKGFGPLLNSLQKTARTAKPGTGREQTARRSSRVGAVSEKNSGPVVLLCRKAVYAIARGRHGAPFGVIAPPANSMCKVAVRQRLWRTWAAFAFGAIMRHDTAVGTVPASDFGTRVHRWGQSAADAGAPAALPSIRCSRGRGIFCGLTPW